MRTAMLLTLRRAVGLPLLVPSQVTLTSDRERVPPRGSLCCCCCCCCCLGDASAALPPASAALARAACSSCRCTSCCCCRRRCCSLTASSTSLLASPAASCPCFSPCCWQRSAHSSRRATSSSFLPSPSRPAAVHSSRRVATLSLFSVVLLRRSAASSCATSEVGARAEAAAVDKQRAACRVGPAGVVERRAPCRRLNCVALQAHGRVRHINVPHWAEHEEAVGGLVGRLPRWRLMGHYNARECLRHVVEYAALAMRARWDIFILLSQRRRSVLPGSDLSHPSIAFASQNTPGLSPSPALVV